MNLKDSTIYYLFLISCSAFCFSTRVYQQISIKKIYSKFEINEQTLYSTAATLQHFLPLTLNYFIRCGITVGRWQPPPSREQQWEEEQERATQWQFLFLRSFVNILRENFSPHLKTLKTKHANGINTGFKVKQRSNSTQWTVDLFNLKMTPTNSAEN